MARKFLTGINMNNYPITGLPAPAGAGYAAEYSWVLNQIASSSTAAAGSRNLLINGAFNVDQRSSGAAKTVVAGAALVYNIDRWWSACTGANVTAQQSTGLLPNYETYVYTGATGCTGIKHGQRIECLNSYQAAGSNVMLSVDLANSLLTTVTWTLYGATSKDTFGTLASPSKTQIATGTFTVNSTMSRYVIGTPIAVGSSYYNGLELVLSVGAQTSGTWKIGRVQLEVNTIATGFEYIPTPLLTSACNYYFIPAASSANDRIFSGSLAGSGHGNWPLGTTEFPPMRVPPAIKLTPGTTSGVTFASVTENSISRRSFVIAANTTGATDYYFYFTYSADAEMYT